MKERPKKVSLSLPPDLIEWWFSLEDQGKAGVVQGILRKSASFKAWEKREKASQ